MSHLMKENQERDQIMVTMSTSISFLTKRLAENKLKKVNMVDDMQGYPLQMQETLSVKVLILMLTIFDDGKVVDEVEVNQCVNLEEDKTILSPEDIEKWLVKKTMDAKIERYTERLKLATMRIPFIDAHKEMLDFAKYLKELLIKNRYEMPKGYENILVIDDPKGYMIQQIQARRLDT
ncbi:hypothetical protein HAX54_030398 [Datura stramonium]|uniref:Uncharacterized protein n=1 Tax=Datura stramonium TaxID=4076 RepID=A0ABS8VAH0_DATST|nr:hypothetical protein [Datura stramonium]